MDLFQICKIIALLLYFPLYCGIIWWAFSDKQSTLFESYRFIPLEED